MFFKRYHNDFFEKYGKRSGQHGSLPGHTKTAGSGGRQMLTDFMKMMGMN